MLETCSVPLPFMAGTKDTAVSLCPRPQPLPSTPLSCRMVVLGRNAHIQAIDRRLETHGFSEVQGLFTSAPACQQQPRLAANATVVCWTETSSWV